MVAMVQTELHLEAGADLPPATEPTAEMHRAWAWGGMLRLGVVMGVVLRFCYFQQEMEARVLCREVQAEVVFEPF